MAKKQEKQVEQSPPVEAPSQLQTVQIRQLNLTQTELVHIRDMFSLLLPPELSTTLSQALAASQGRHLEESRLWTKICEACVSAEIPMGDSAPDFIVSVTGTPSIGVFQLADNLRQSDAQLKQELQVLLD
jgi:hypothetical protein